MGRSAPVVGPWTPYDLEARDAEDSLVLAERAWITRDEQLRALIERRPRERLDLPRIVVWDVTTYVCGIAEVVDRVLVQEDRAETSLLSKLQSGIESALSALQPFSAEPSSGRLVAGGVLCLNDDVSEPGRPSAFIFSRVEGGGIGGNRPKRLWELTADSGTGGINASEEDDVTRFGQPSDVLGRLVGEDHAPPLDVLLDTVHRVPAGTVRRAEALSLAPLLQLFEALRRVHALRYFGYAISDTHEIDLTHADRGEHHCPTHQVAVTDELEQAWPLVDIDGISQWIRSLDGGQKAGAGGANVRQASRSSGCRLFNDSFERFRLIIEPVPVGAEGCSGRIAVDTFSHRLTEHP